MCAQVFARTATVRGAAPLAAILVIATALGGCAGSTGAAGPAGATGAPGAAGPPTPTGPVTALDVGTATAITATITGVTVPAAPAAGQPVVKFLLVDQIGQPLKGLPASDLGFIIAKLVPPGTQLAAVPPQTTAPRPQSSAQWQSYIYTSASPAPVSAGQGADLVVGTTAQPQATVEPGTSGAFIDNGNGTYQYTFKTDIASGTAVTYNAALVHRVGFEIRGVAPANSPVYTFQPSTGDITGLNTNAIVDDHTCLNCHQELAFHGGARTEVQYCVMCHNPSSIEASSGNSLDFKVMFHKIHAGAKLPSVVAGSNYYMFGFRNSISDYSLNQFPTTATLESPQSTCYTCHNESDAATPQTVNWRDNPNIEACGACHDDVNFTTGANHSAANLGNLKDTDCVTCHGPNATASVGATPPPGSVLLPNTPLHVASVHANPVRAYAAQFAYSIQKVDLSNLATPKVTFTVSDPTTPGHNWNILSDTPFTFCPADPNAAATDIGISLAWTTTDYTNTGTTATDKQPGRVSLFCGGNPAGAPVANGDGSFTATLPAIPAAAVAGYSGLGAGGKVGVMMDGFPVHDFGLGGTEVGYVPSLACAPAPAAAALPPSGQPGASPNACGTVGTATSVTTAVRRDIVSVAKCDNCHDQISFHGGHRVDSVQACSVCHNPEATDVQSRIAAGVTNAAGTAVTATPAPDGAVEQPIDLKFLVHRAHFQAFLNSQTGKTNTYVVYHRASASLLDSPTTFSSANGGVAESNNCLACHNADSYYLPDPATQGVIATTVASSVAGVPDAPSPAGKLAITPGAAACYTCHVTTQDVNHMISTGGAGFGNITPALGTKDVNSHITAGINETCNICHGPGTIADVKVVHTGIH